MRRNLTLVVIRFGLSLTLLSLLFAGSARHAAAAATIIYVRYNATGANNGTSWANAYKNLQIALSHARSGQQIWVAKGVYKPTGGADRTISFTLISGVAMYGGFAGTETLLSQRHISANVTALDGDIGILGDSTDNSFHVAWGETLSTATILDGFTIRNGNAHGAAYPNNEGGGLFLFGSDMLLRNLVFSMNGADFGGGIGNESSSPTITNVVIKNNRATGVGGGMQISSTSSPHLTNVTFQSNTSGDGGGLVSAGAPVLKNVAFKGNTASSRGGGMFVSASGLGTLNSVSFTNNHADTGGGIYDAASSAPVLNKVAFTNNAATTSGGGMFNISSNPTLSGVTFLGNTASVSGGALYNTSSSPALTNTTFTANHAPAGAGVYNYASSPVFHTATFSGNSGGSGGGMYNNNASSPVLNKVTFGSNGATYDGGSMFNGANSNPSMTGITFSKNVAQYGGGMYNSLSNPAMTVVVFSANTADEGAGMYSLAGFPSLSRARFLNNTASMNGGGIYNDGSAPALFDSTFAGNHAGWGAGMFNTNSSAASLNNVTFSGNAASGIGGGMYNNASAPAITNATFYGNSAANKGGGMYNDAGSGPTIINATFSANSAVSGAAMYNATSGPKISESILWGDGSSEFVSDSNLPSMKDSIVQGGCPALVSCLNVMSGNPRLGPLQNNGGFTQTMALGVRSVAIDAGGGNVACASGDQRGVARPQGWACDLGAYEVRAMRFTSQAANDGQVLESAAGSNIGGAANASAGTMLVGDAASDRRYRAFVSFNTSALPDAAMAVFARLTVRQSTLPTGDPFGNDGKLVADVARPYFGTSVALAASDWQAVPTVSNVGSLLSDSTYYNAALNGLGIGAISKTATTQFRLRFALVNNNGLPDDLTLYSSNDPTAADWPVLLVYYNP